MSNMATLDLSSFKKATLSLDEALIGCKRQPTNKFIRGVILEELVRWVSTMR